MAQSWPTLCDPTDCGLPGSSLHGICQQECWSGLPFPSLKDPPNPGIEPASPLSPALAGGFFTHWAIRKAHFKHTAEIFFKRDRNKTLKSWFSYRKPTSGSFRVQSQSHSSYNGEEDTIVKFSLQSEGALIPPALQSRRLLGYLITLIHQDTNTGPWGARVG